MELRTFTVIAEYINKNTKHSKKTKKKDESLSRDPHNKANQAAKIKPNPEKKEMVCSLSPALANVSSRGAPKFTSQTEEELLRSKRECSRRDITIITNLLEKKCCRRPQLCSIILLTY